jgi:hypothetical protein
VVLHLKIETARQEVKLQHWQGVSAILTREGTPNGDLRFLSPHHEFPASH